MDGGALAFNDSRDSGKMRAPLWKVAIMTTTLYALLAALLILVPILLVMLFVLKRDLNRAQQRIKTLESRRDFDQKHIRLLSRQLAQRSGRNKQRSPEDSKRPRRAGSRASGDDRTHRDSVTGSAAGLSIGTALGIGTSLF